MSIRVVTLLALLSAGCAYHAPDAPTPAPPASTTAPFSLTLGAAVGQGTDAGRAVVTAKVQNVNGAVLPGVTVGFSTDVGTLSPPSAITDTNGIAATMVVASSSAKVTATAGGLTTQMLVSSQPVVPGPTPNPAPEPPPSSPLGPLSMTVSATAVVFSNPTVPTIFTLNVLNASGAFNVTWDYGDGGTSTSTSSTSAHAYGAAGTYRVTAILRDDAGRSTSASTNAVVSAPPVVPPPPPPSPSISVTVVAAPILVVTSATTNITATAVAANGAAAVTSYTLDCETDGTLEATQASPNFTCAYSTVGSKTITVTATNGTQTGTGTTTVTVNAAPAPTITVSCNTGVKVGVAPPSSCSVSASVNGAPVPSSRVTKVTWDFGDGTAVATDVPGNQSPNHNYTTANTFTVFATATISGANGGTASNSTTTTIAP